MITIVDSGFSNPDSVVNMLKRIGAESIIASDPPVIGNVDKTILPGVGAFDSAIRNIDELRLRKIITEKLYYIKSQPLAFAWACNY